MTTTDATHIVSISSSTPKSRNGERTLTLAEDSNQTDVTSNLMKGIPADGVPVKFADNLFSVLIKDQVSQLLALPSIKRLAYTEENAIRKLIQDLTEIIKRIISQRIKQNYKAVIQVMAYPRVEENNIIIMSQCLWNYRTDDVLSIEIETDTLKFLILIHGLAT